METIKHPAAFQAVQSTEPGPPQERRASEEVEEASAPHDQMRIEGGCSSSAGGPGYLGSGEYPNCNMALLKHGKNRCEAMGHGVVLKWDCLFFWLIKLIPMANDANGGWIYLSYLQFRAKKMIVFRLGIPG